MDRKKLRELIDFASDEQRLDAAFQRVARDIDAGTIDVEDLPIAAAPVNPGALNEPEQKYIAELLEEHAGVTLDAEQKLDLLRVIHELPGDRTMADLEVAVGLRPKLAALALGLRQKHHAIFGSTPGQQH